MRLKYSLIFIFVIICLFSISSVCAGENNTEDLLINENEIEELDISDSQDNISQSDEIQDPLESKKIYDYVYDQAIEIEAQDVKIVGDVDKKISFRVKNLDYDSCDPSSEEYPRLQIDFYVYKNGKLINEFLANGDENGYVTFWSSYVTCSVEPFGAGVYTVVAKYDATRGSCLSDEYGGIYYKYLSAEKKFTITQIPEYKWTVKGNWNGQSYKVLVKLTEKQYKALKNAKKNKKTKEIGPIHTNKYVKAKITKTKKLVIYKIVQNKKTGKITEKWAKNWKVKVKKLIKQGYKSKLHKKLSKNNGKIWMTFKKTYKKKYEIKATVSTIAKNGMLKKGDYISLYAAEPMKDKKITI